MSSSTATTQPQSLDLDTALARVRDLVPVIAERSTDTDRARMVPAESIRQIQEAGLFGVHQPARYGGAELELADLYELGSQMSRGCTSTGWVYSVLASHSWIVGMFPAEAQDDVWGEDPHTLVSSSFGLGGPELEPVPGGYRFPSARYGFSTGCDHAGWAILIAQLPVGEVYEPVWMLVPRSDWEIVDDWFVAAMKGTGSKSLTLGQTFVPEHRVVRVAELQAGESPGREVNRGPLFGVPLRSGLAFSLLAPAAGGVLGAIDALGKRIRSRPEDTSPEGIAGSAPVHVRVGQATAHVDAVRALIRTDNDQIFGLVRSGSKPDFEQQQRYRLHFAYMVELCLDAVEMVFRAGGGTSLAESNPLQRFWRDVHGAASHRSFDWDGVRRLFGRTVLEGGVRPDWRPGPPPVRPRPTST